MFLNDIKGSSADQQVAVQTSARHILIRATTPVEIRDAEEKLAQMREWSEARGVDGSLSLNERRLTNAGVFRAYCEAYLRAHPDIRQDMTLLVRQLAPGPTGLPIEIYVFTNTTVWADYEAIQADIFDHLLAAVPEFGLEVFQEPTGNDFESLVRSL